MNLIDEIKQLKKETGTLMLAHYYEDAEIQDVADDVGDSLYLAQKGQNSSAQTVLLAGVYFMGESVKILSPEKTVLVPDTNAGCSLVDHSPFDKYLAWRLKHPSAICVTYINSSAAVKSISDITCTSSNAEKIIQAIPKNRPILFGPDRNLGRYLAQKTGRKMILWPGSCEVHVLFSARKLFELKKTHSEAPVLAHPECIDAILEQANVIGSTSRLLKEVETSHAKTFIVATESGIFHQMQKSRPDVKLIQAPAEGSCACNECPYMKLNTLEKIKIALTTQLPQIEVPTQYIQSANTALSRMMDLTNNQPVVWPEKFEYTMPPRHSLNESSDEDVHVTP